MANDINWAERYANWTYNNITATQGIEQCICVQAKSSAGYEEVPDVDDGSFQRYMEYNLRANCGLGFTPVTSAYGKALEIRLGGEDRCLAFSNGTVLCGKSNHQAGSKFRLVDPEKINCDDNYGIANDWREKNGLPYI